MKTKEVLELLRITRQTLTKYVKDKTIRVKVLPNGRYEYNDEDVYKILNKGMKRQTVIYARVSAKQQRRALEEQIKTLKQFCYSNGWTVDAVFKDIALDIDFKHRKELLKMIELATAGKIERIVVLSKDKLSQVNFDLFDYLFKRYSMEIVVLNQANDYQFDEQEMTEEIAKILDAYSVKVHSKQKKEIIKQLIEESNERIYKKRKIKETT